jgi:uncharacterized membrane-anchored protein
MQDWVNNPNKKQLGLYSVLWFIGVALLALAVTNFFTESPFVRRNGLVILLVTFPTIILIRMIRNYFIRNKK